MDQTVSIAKDLAANPTPELQELLNDPRTTDSARQAVADVVSPARNVNGVSNGNGHASNTTSGLVNKAGEGRLQVVDENQNFTCVPSFFASCLALTDTDH